MAELDAQPRKTFRGTWGQLLDHKDDIPAASEVEVRVFWPTMAADPTIALLESWIAEAPTDQLAIQQAEEDLLEFKRNMNFSRKDVGARIHYPEAE